jgi:preprotein translocase subunit SecD
VKKNRAKIIIILVFIAGAIYGLYPTYQSRTYSAELEKFGTSPKDSLARVKWLTDNGEGMKNANAKAIKLGLDLRGGIYVTMEVDVLKFLEEQTMQKDDIFAQVLAATARDEATSTDPTVTIFMKNFKEIASPKGKALANYFFFTGATDDAAIQAQLQKGAEEAVDQAKEIIRNRIDQFGLTEPTIQREGARRIIIELPGVGDPTQVHQLLEGTAQLEFRLVKAPELTQKILEKIDRVLASDSLGSLTAIPDTAKKLVVDSAAKNTAEIKAPEKKAGKKALASADSARKDTTAQATAKLSPEDSAHRADSLAYAGLTQAQREVKLKKEHPLTYILGKGITKDGRVFVTEDDRKVLKLLLGRKDAQSVYGDELSFMFGKPLKDAKGGTFYELFFLNDKAELTGKVITGARADISQDNGMPEVTMQMDDDGAKEWKRITGANIHKKVAIVLDSVVYSAPTVNQQIPNGNSQITGSGDMSEANLLAIILKAGALPAPVKIIQEQVVGPSLGADSISKGTWSIFWSFIVVMVFMGMYYLTGGFVADIAVFINLLITLAVLATFGATLTLPGMAGLVLTVGIAVDANVLIYERIREELAAGKSLKLAIDDGYRRAFAPIFDGHLTAFFSGVILYSFGTGTVQGFAVTLMIGIAASLFTAIIITRVIMDILLENKPELINFG